MGLIDASQSSPVAELGHELVFNRGRNCDVSGANPSWEKKHETMNEF